MEESVIIHPTWDRPTTPLDLQQHQIDQQQQDQQHDLLLQQQQELNQQQEFLDTDQFE